MFEVKINNDHIVQKFSGAYVKTDVEKEIIEFLDSNNIKFDRRLVYHNKIDYKFRYDIIYQFESESDAMLFTLMWG